MRSARSALAAAAFLLAFVALLASAFAGCGDLALNLLLPDATTGEDAGASPPTVFPCDAASQCADASSGPYCSLEAGACVECLSNSNCSGSTPHCIDGVCVSCITSADCPSGKVCNTHIPRCETACTNGDTCLEAGVQGPCASDYGYCVECLSNDDCTAAPLFICNPPPYGICVQCMSNTDCKAGATCGPTQHCISP